MEMNTDMKIDLEKYKVNVTNSILTEPSLTSEQIKETISMMRKNKTHEFWLFLRRHPSASKISEYLYLKTPKETKKDLSTDDKKKNK